MVVITFIDIDHKLILDKVTHPVDRDLLRSRRSLPERRWWDGLIGAAVGYGVPWLIGEMYYRIREREGLGLGDGKLLAVVGALLGLFEYNFGDSEFLMLFLLLDHAAVRRRAQSGPHARMRLPRARPARARATVAGFPGIPVLVVGDVMLDRFIVGRVDADLAGSAGAGRAVSVGAHAGSAARRTSRTTSPRSAAQVSLVGIVGRRRGRRRALRELLAAAAFAIDGLVEDSTRPTVEKVRIVTERNQQVARIDYEADADEAGEVESA